MSTQNFSYLMFNRGAKTLRCKKENIFNKQCWKTWTMYICRFIKLDIYLLNYKNHKLNKDLIVKTLRASRKHWE